MIDGFETQSLQVGVASHEERESSSWSWEEDFQQPDLDSCEGKNWLSWRGTGPVPTPWQLQNALPGHKEAGSISGEEPGQAGSRYTWTYVVGVIVLHVILHFCYPETFSKDTQTLQSGLG